MGRARNKARHGRGTARQGRRHRVQAQASRRLAAPSGAVTGRGRLTLGRVGHADVVAPAALAGHARAKGAHLALRRGARAGGRRGGGARSASRTAVRQPNSEGRAAGGQRRMRAGRRPAPSCCPACAASWRCQLAACLEPHAVLCDEGDEGDGRLEDGGHEPAAGTAGTAGTRRGSARARGAGNRPPAARRRFLQRRAGTQPAAAAAASADSLPPRPLPAPATPRRRQPRTW